MPIDVADKCSEKKKSEYDPAKIRYLFHEVRSPFPGSILPSLATAGEGPQLNSNL